MKFKGVLVTSMFLSSTTLLSGCGLFGEGGYIRNRNNEYKNAQTSPRMQVPDGYDQSAIQDIMPVPETTRAENTWQTDESTVPPPKSLLSSQDSDGISIQYTGNQRWILIDAPKNQVWPYIESFWQVNGIDIAKEDASYGEAQTQWLSLDQLNEPLKMKLLSRVLDRDEPQGLYDKFKINLQHGVRKGSTEVHLIQISSKTQEQNPEWPKQSENLSLEAAMLNELLVHIAKMSQENASSSYLAQNAIPSSEDRAQLIKDGNGNPILRVNLEFERAWNGVQQALESAQFTITKTNREFNQYQIEYLVDESGSIELPDNSEPGFFAKLFGNGEAKKSKAITNELIIKLSQISGGVDVTVQTSADTLASPDIAEQVLSIIKDYLI